MDSHVAHLVCQVQHALDKHVLLANIFPQSEPAAGGSVTDERLPLQQYSIPPLTLDEVRDIVFQAQPFKAPRPEEIPTVAWKELWSVVGPWIHLLFTASLLCNGIP